MRYILDSDILTALEDSETVGHREVFSRMGRLAEDDALCISVATLYEYAYGIYNAPDQPMAERLSNARETLLELFEVIPLTIKGADVYGKLKAQYQKNIGTKSSALKRHNMDLILASTALEQGAILVSGDRLFETLSGLTPQLRLENWLLP